MPHTITPEERRILLAHPELVMFDPYSAVKTHRRSLGKALILPVIAAAAILLWGLLCPGFLQAHPGAFAGIGCAALVAACGVVPVFYLRSDDRTFRKAEAEHYARQLAMLLPEDLECGIARVLWVTEQQAEGGWILDGKEGVFGYASYVNYFRIEPGMDLAVVRGGDKFCAFVKREAETECFYRE